MIEFVNVVVAAIAGFILGLTVHSAYLHRDEICVVTFREKEASVVLKPTRTALLEKEKLQQIHVGGATPLALGLKRGLEVIERRAKSAVATEFVLISDGKANVGFSHDPFADALSVAERIACVATRRVFINPSPVGKEPALRSRCPSGLGCEERSSI